MLTKSDKYKKGDWIRFLQQGELRIGQIEYVTEDGTSAHAKELVTDAGVVSIRSVLEHRPKPQD